MTEIDEVVKEFLVESAEGLDRLDRDLVALEQNPEDRERIASIFRTIHTIKGTCGFLGLSKLESVAHVGESLLTRVRDGKVRLTTEVASTLLGLVDAVREMLAAIEDTGQEGAGDYADLIQTLTRLQAEANASPPTPAPSPPHPPAPIAAAPATPTPAAAPLPPPAPAAAAPHAASDVAPQEPSEVRNLAASDSVLRVDVGLLDKLMNLVGELVLTRNQVLQHTAGKEDTALSATTARLNLITTELQEGVMKTRMQPIDNVWSKLPRVVRDLATASGKHIRIEMEGKETELDKTIIEAIKDPLTHLVRNAVDHGIEAPAVRTQQGKPAEGVLRLRAYHEGGQVNIEISDDGAGLDLERIRQKALQRGLITAEQSGRMGERELSGLIFLPGFSTAEKVTNVSGRGVGMDVVKTNVEKIGGTVDVQSAPGGGTTFKIKIPLTLAIIPALIITSGGDRFAIPQVSLLELVRLEGDEALKSIEMFHGAPVYRLRGNLLPLVHLDKALQLDRAGSDEPDCVNIVVLQADDRQFGLVVDAVNDSEEIVVKPLGRQLKGITTFAGATIMGDGAVALILDVLGLAQATDVVTAGRERSRAETTARSTSASATRQTVLITSAGGDRRLAMPLNAVDRLEQFPRSSVERSGAREVVQYRGRILPLVRVADVLGFDAAAQGEQLPVVVHTLHGRSFGLVVDAILDIVEQEIALEKGSDRRGMLGSAVIQGHVTDLLDLDALVTESMGSDGTTPAATENTA